MAKSVAEALRRRAERARQQPPSPEVVGGTGFTKIFTDEEVARIEAERKAMRDRLLAK